MKNDKNVYISEDTKISTEYFWGERTLFINT